LYVRFARGQRRHPNAARAAHFRFHQRAVRGRRRLGERITLHAVFECNVSFSILSMLTMSPCAGFVRRSSRQSESATNDVRALHRRLILSTLSSLIVHILTIESTRRLIVIVNTTAYCANKFLCVDYRGGVDNTGSLYTTHIFGAAFGLGCAMIGNARAHVRAHTHTHTRTSTPNVYVILNV
jgi:hypothetical protein